MSTITDQAALLKCGSREVSGHKDDMYSVVHVLHSAPGSFVKTAPAVSETCSYRGIGSTEMILLHSGRGFLRQQSLVGAKGSVSIDCRGAYLVAF